MACILVGILRSGLACLMSISFFSKKIFHIHLGIAIFYTAGGLFIFGSSFISGKIYNGMTLNETIFWLWIMYIIIISLLPFSFILPKIKNQNSQQKHNH